MLLHLDIQSFIHSLNTSFLHSFSLISFTKRFTHSVTNALVHLFIRSFMHACIRTELQKRKHFNSFVNSIAKLPSTLLTCRGRGGNVR